jgi:hypothetical protein
LTPMTSSIGDVGGLMKQTWMTIFKEKIQWQN